MEGFCDVTNANLFLQQAVNQTEIMILLSMKMKENPQ